ncbi:metallophosphoesterase [Singulisphaera sp. Ch08]|uniref:Metallophosphoesterase n=1 Tax=Singulisphaera sp. Ch08 TaxID=3120278 RepID=A0AAU7CAL1_9BACT
MHIPALTPPQGFDRRSFLKMTGGLAAAFAAGGTSFGKPSERNRVLRVAHITDIHVQPERRAPEGLASCLKHIQSLQDKPDLILSGGDHVMDSVRQTRDRTKTQWDIWTNVLKAENSIPVKSCIGNHDIWGWEKDKSGATGNEPDFGKKWAIDALGLPNRYYSFTQAGWHFITLDGVQPAGPVGDGSHSAYLDEEQLDWFKRDLASVPKTTPILIWSHVPIVSALPITNPRPTLTGNIYIEEGHVHSDAGVIVNELAQYPNVKACLSGHLHQVEQIEIKGINFHCNGAVCGGWWKGKNRGFDEGFALVDLYDDGSYECRYETYGWVAEPPK